MSKFMGVFVGALLVFTMLIATPNAASGGADPDSFGLVDPSTGIWHLYEDGVEATWFYYGNPGDSPFMGDWDCDGIDTPGLYRQSDGYAYLRNSNSGQRQCFVLLRQPG
jgi:hypothetical protein